MNGLGRRLLPAVLTAGLMAVAGGALADGPSGSHEEDVVCDPATGICTTQWDNEVACGSGGNVAGASVYVGANGVEACNDDGDLPMQGRVIATTDDGGYVAADGDNSNPAEAQGWIRVDQSGVRCGDPAGNRDSTHPGPSDGSQHCG